MTPRTCPECGVTFQPKNGRQTFCTTAHKRHFWHLMAHRGQMLTPFALTHRAGKHGAHATLASWSRTQYCALLDRWNAEDKAAGRNPALTVLAKQDAAWRHVDVDT